MYQVSNSSSDKSNLTLFLCSSKLIKILHQHLCNAVMILFYHYILLHGLNLAASAEVIFLVQVSILSMNCSVCSPDSCGRRLSVNSCSNVSNSPPVKLNFFILGVSNRVSPCRERRNCKSSTMLAFFNCFLTGSCSRSYHFSSCWFLQLIWVNCCLH